MKKRITIKEGSYVVNTETQKRILSKKDFGALLEQTKMGYCYYFVKDVLFKTAKSNVKEFASCLSLLIGALLICTSVNVFACSRDISELTPETQAKYFQLKEACDAEGIEIKAICTYRTQAEQNDLYAKGRTKPGVKVTWTKRSRHTDREAFDVAVFKPDGTINWQGEAYLRVGDIAKHYGLVWGGDWKVRDYGHFELGAEK